MNSFYEFITNPSTKELEKKTEEIDWIKIETKLAEIQKDLQRIKEELNKSSRK